MARRRRRKARRLPEQWQEEGMPADQSYGQSPLGSAMAPGSHSQLEALLGTTSQPQQALGGVQSEFGAGGWAGSGGARSPAPQAGSNAMHSMMGGLGGGVLSSTGGGPLSSAGGLPRHSSPGGLFASSGLSSGSNLAGGSGSGGISPGSVGPGGICMDFLAGRCPRGAACSLSHMLPSLPASAALSSAAMQQQTQSFLQPHQQYQVAAHHQQHQQHLQQQQQQQHHAASVEHSDGMVLLRGMEMTRATAEITRQELGAVVMGQARLLQEQAAGLATLEKQVVDLQRYFSNALLTFEQRHWAALLGNEQRITNKVEQTIGQVVAAIDSKFEAMRLAQQEEGLIRRALSSNASTAQWPAQLAAGLAAPRAATGIASGPTSEDTMQPRGLPAAMGRLNMGSGEVRLPPVSAGATASGSGRAGPSPEQEEVEALLREISASSAGGSGSGGYAAGDSAGGSGGTPRNGGSTPSGSTPRPSPPQQTQQQHQQPKQQGGGNAQPHGGDGAAGSGGGDEDDGSVVGSTSGVPTGGRRSSSVPDEVVREVKELQDEETGQLLRVFKEHASNSSGSGSAGGNNGGRASSDDAAKPTTPSSDRSRASGGPSSGNSGGGGPQPAVSYGSTASSGSDARSGDVRAKLDSIQAQQSSRRQQGDGQRSG